MAYAFKAPLLLQELAAVLTNAFSWEPVTQELGDDQYCAEELRLRMQSMKEQ